LRSHKYSALCCHPFRFGPQFALHCHVEKVTNDDHFDCSGSVISARRRGMGIFPLSRVAPAPAVRLVHNFVSSLSYFRATAPNGRGSETRETEPRPLGSGCFICDRNSEIGYLVSDVTHNAGRAGRPHGVWVDI
jgi:hypothetical protein